MRKRGISTAVKWISLVMALICAYAWWRGYHAATVVEVYKGVWIQLSSDKGWGGFHVGTARDAPGDPIDITSAPLAVNIGNPRLERYDPSLVQGIKSMEETGIPGVMRVPKTSNFRIPATPLVPEIFITAWWIRLPMWFWQIAFFVLPVREGIKWSRRPPLYPAGCVHCGYDLRGHAAGANENKIICPECGTLQAAVRPEAPPRRSIWRRTLGVVNGGMAWASAFGFCLVAALLVVSWSGYPKKIYAGWKDAVAMAAYRGNLVLFHVPDSSVAAADLDPTQSRVWFSAGMEFFQGWSANDPYKVIGEEPFYGPWHGTTAQASSRLRLADFSGDSSYVRLPAWPFLMVLAIWPAWALLRWFRRSRHDCVAPHPR